MDHRFWGAVGGGLQACRFHALLSHQRIVEFDGDPLPLEISSHRVDTV